jgi:hypothetical protein
MKRNISIFVLLLTIHACFGQIVFERGYFIDNNNNKTECLIKNYDWRTNPVKIEYKLDDSTYVRKTDITAIKEFGIYDFSRFIRAKVKIDRSSVDINHLSTKRSSEWSEEQLFLKEIVCGNATLLSYADNDQIWYFYSVDNSEIQQLIYKEFVLDSERGLYIHTNNGFQQQISVELQDANTNKVKIENLKYNEKDLKEYFKLYNQTGNYCTRTDFSGKVREVYNFKVLAAVDYSKISFSNPIIISNAMALDNTTTWIAGLEAEVFLPFNKNTWSLVVEPCYEHIKNEKPVYFSNTINLDLQSVTFPTGLRYTNYLNRNFKLFLNGFFIPWFNISFSSDLYIFNSKMSISQRNSIALGVGASYKNISAEFRYYSSREIMSNYVDWSTDYQRLAFILSYTLYHKTGK